MDFFVNLCRVTRTSDLVEQTRSIAMKHVTQAGALLLLSAAALAGCESSGLSPREVPGRNQSAYLYSLYEHDLREPGAEGPVRPLKLPTAVAVVQVGEVAPPQPMIDALRKDAGVFSRVESLPGTDLAVPDGRYANNAGNASPPPLRPTLATLRHMAADAGTDYVLLVGGSVDHGTTGTPMSILDLTIIGAFVVPSQETRGTARAAAALVDVQSGRIVVNSSAEARRSTIAPSAASEGAEIKLLERLRDEVVAKLGTQVLADAKNRAGLPAAPAAMMSVH
jgi:hypothetical protein